MVVWVTCAFEVFVVWLLLGLLWVVVFIVLCFGGIVYFGVYWLVVGIA